MCGGKWVSAIAVVVTTVIGIGAVRWDDAHRTVDLEESPWVRAAGQAEQREEAAAEAVYAKPVVVAVAERDG